MAKEIIIGIDLGTTNSVVGIWDGSEPRIVYNADGLDLTPSVVSYTKDEILVGEAGKTKHLVNPLYTLYDMKRLLGKPYKHEDIQKNMKYWTFELADEEKRPVAVVTQNNRTFHVRPEEVSAKVLEECKKIAETVTRQEVKKAVITVPAYFNQPQKKATKKAAELAGLEVAELITEPTAAAYAYGFDKKEFGHGRDGAYNLLVFDFGGGTLDVVIIRVARGKFKVLSVGGDSQLGGRDIDVLLMDYVAGSIREQYGRDAMANHKTKQKLNKFVVEAKRHLSKAVRSEIFIENIIPGLEEELDLTREELENILQPILNTIEEKVHQAIDKVAKFGRRPKMTAADIDEVLLIGGSSRIPAVKKLLERIFPGKKLNESINPDTAVAKGAAVRAGQLMNGEAVSQMSLLEAVPISIGGMLYDGVFERVIHGGMTLPVRPIRKTYHTIENDQTEMSFQFYEGEREVAYLNNYLGSFVLTGITPGMAGSQTVVVTAEMDRDGILQVKAEHGDKVAYLNVDYTAERETEKTPDELREEALMFKKKDQAEMHKIDIRGHIDVRMQQIDYKLNKENYSGEDKPQIEQQWSQIKAWLEANQDPEMNAYRDKKVELDQIFNKMTKAKKTPRRQSAPSSSGGGKTKTTRRKTIATSAPYTTPYTAKRMIPIKKKKTPQAAPQNGDRVSSIVQQKFPHMFNAMASQWKGKVQGQADDPATSSRPVQHRPSTPHASSSSASLNVTNFISVPGRLAVKRPNPVPPKPANNENVVPNGSGPLVSISGFQDPHEGVRIKREAEMN